MTKTRSPQAPQITPYFSDPHTLMVTARGLAQVLWPYFAPAFRRMTMIQAPGLGTAGVSQWGHLLYDPKVMLELANAHGTREAKGDTRTGIQDGQRSAGRAAATMAIAGVWYHEALHWLLDHGPSRRGGRDPKMWNIAADLYINGSLVRAGGCLPLGIGVYPEQYVTVDGEPFPETATVEHYYALLKAGGQPKDGEPQDGPGSGRCGSGAGGEPLPGEPDGPSEQAGGCTPEDREDVQVECAQAAQEYARRNADGAGKLPLGWERWVVAKEPPQISWRQHLDHATTSALDKLGRGRKVYTRPNSRQAALYGRMRGAPVMPVRCSQLARVWLVIDTSGSMSEEQVGLGIGLIRQLCAARGVDLYVFACDADVHGKPRKVRRVDDAKPAILGGGGTDFRPIFALYDQTSPADRPNLIQVWTDGDGPAPERAPQGCSVQWLLSCPHERPRVPAPWGEVITVPLAKGGNG